jgi:hypothetical protein
VITEIASTASKTSKKRNFKRKSSDKDDLSSTDSEAAPTSDALLNSENTSKAFLLSYNPFLLL